MIIRFSLLCFMISWQLGAADVSEHSPAKIKRTIGYKVRDNKTVYYTSFCTSNLCVKQIKEGHSKGGSPKVTRFKTQYKPHYKPSPRTLRLDPEKHFKALQNLHYEFYFDADQ